MRGVRSSGARHSGRALVRVVLASLLAWPALVVAVWALVERPRGGLTRLHAVGELTQLARPRWALALAAALAIALGAGLARWSAGARAKLRLESLVAAALAVPAVLVAIPRGHVAAAMLLALVGALGVALHLPRLDADRRAEPGAESSDARGSERALVFGVWLFVAAVSAVFALHRHHAFGSGSWDMGCMIHNFFRASRLLDTTSTVLGDVDFLGDHFMAGIWLYAPITRLWSGGSALVVIQSVNLAAVAPATFTIARRAGAAPVPALAIALATGFAFGMQSAHYFDSHEIAVGFGFLAWGVAWLEAGRYRAATLALLTFASFKESLGAYIVGLGLLLVWRGAWNEGVEAHRQRRWGAAWVALGVIVFVLVNRVFMPYFRARANAPEPHETFGDFGPTVFLAVLGVLRDPLRALLALFVGEEKLASIAVTLSGTGFLALLAPELLIPAAPLVAERFLSSKSTMWEMGYHYAAPLCFYAGWATALAYPRVERLARALVDALGPAEANAADRRRRVGVALTIYVLAAMVLTNAVGYRHPSNFLRWEEDYFTRPARRADHRAAIAFVEAQGRDARVAAQNRLLPHLADRAFIYRLGERERADWILLSLGESAWPYDDGLPERVARELLASTTHRLAFVAGETLVFARGREGATAPPPPRLAPTPVPAPSPDESVEPAR